MTTLRRILSIVTLCTLMSGSALVAAAQTLTEDVPDVQEDQQYDQPQGNLSTQPEMAQPQDQDQVLPPPSNESGRPIDPPARAARLQYTSGSVSVQPQGTGDWVAGEINRPLTNSDNIWADKNSRAEISVGTGLIRIGSESSLTLTDVGENVVQLQLHQGALNLHVRRLYDNERYEVDTPNQAFTVEKPGDYRFDVNPDADRTIVTVWSGEGESTGDGPAVRIHANEQVRFSNGTSLTVDAHAAPGPDDFDQWAQSRDHRLDHSASSRYVSPDTVGYEDLDEYGTWKETPDYGAVWVPAVAPGWAPYYYGHWVWEDPWGWSWVDYEPWGFAPFHYGRWVYADGGWGWAPGPIYARPFYAPAMVAWFGGGGWGFSVGFGGGLGWCALGWGEPFVPWYGASYGYFRGVNVTNTHITNVNITNIYNNNFVNGRPTPGAGIYSAHAGNQIRYANLHAPGGFTAVPRNTLVNSLSVAHNNIRVAPNQLSRVTPVHSPGIAPTRASIVGSNGARAAVPPAHAFSRPVVSHLAAPNRGSPNPGLANRGPVNASPRAGVNNSSRPGFNNNAARPAQGGGMQRPAVASANGGPAGFNNSRAPQAGTRFPQAGTQLQSGTMGSRSVPRPGNAGNLGGRSIDSNTGRNTGNNIGRGSNGGVGAGANGRPASQIASRGSMPQMVARNNVPRPPMASMPSANPSSTGMGRSQPSYSQQRGGGSPNFSQRGGQPTYSRPSTPQSLPTQRSNGPRSAMSVPRPSSPIAPRGYASTSNSGGYSIPRPASPAPSYQSNNRSYGAGSYSRPSPSYGGGSYSRPAPSPTPSYDRGSSGRAAPSYGGGSYSRPAPAPSYGGASPGRSSYGAPSYGRSSPAPLYGAPSYGRSAPSYGGGYGGASRGPAYGGGFGGGGGAHVSSGGNFGGGGGHFGGGGAGGHASGGGGGHSGGGGHR